MTTYTNDTLGIGSETTGGATTYYTRTPGGRLVDERIGTSAYYYLFDGLGSVVALVDTSAVVKDTYSYDPYGQVTPGGANSVANPWQYTGGYYDATTKLVKLGQRYYDPSLGRFTQLDPMGGGYAYASDNPISFRDPTGLDSEDEVCQPDYSGFSDGTDIYYRGSGRCSRPATSQRLVFQVQEQVQGDPAWYDVDSNAAMCSNCQNLDAPGAGFNDYYMFPGAPNTPVRIRATYTVSSDVGSGSETNILGPYNQPLLGP